MTPFELALGSFVAKSAFILAFTALVAMVCRRPAYKHLIWTAGFVSVLLLPILQFALPAEPVAPALFASREIGRVRKDYDDHPGVRWGPKAAPAPQHGWPEPERSNPLAAEQPARANAERGPTEGPERLDLDVHVRLSRRTSRTEALGRRMVRAGPGRRSEPSEHAGVGQTSATSHDAPSEGLGTAAIQPEGTTKGPGPARPLAPVLWLSVAAALLLHQLLSTLLLARSASRHRAGDPAAHAATAKRAGLRRSWRLIFGRAAGIPSPMTWGVFRPTVSMPAASADWEPERFDAVLIHELVHVRRLDCLTQWLAMLVCALNWFNPLAWLGFRALRAAAEAATDDAVLQSGVKPSTYAKALVQAAADNRYARRAPLLAGVSLMKQTRIENRIRTILDPSRRLSGATRVGALATFAAALLLAAPCAMLQAAAQSPSKQAPKSADSKPVQKKPVHNAVVRRHRAGSDQFREAKLRRAKERIARMEVALARQKFMLDRQQAMLQRRQIEMQRQAKFAEDESQRNYIKSQAGVAQQGLLREAEARRAALAAQMAAEKRAQAAQAEALLDADKAKVNQVRELLKRTDALFKEGAVDQRVRDEKVAEVERAEADLNVARAGADVDRLKMDIREKVADAAANDSLQRARAELDKQNAEARKHVLSEDVVQARKDLLISDVVDLNSRSADQRKLIQQLKTELIRARAEIVRLRGQLIELKNKKP